MSTEDLELRDLVTQALENNGVLSRIRAELRASVFLALEESELIQTETPLVNKTFKSFVKTNEGALLTCLVREFLEYFELDFTMSVYDPETYNGKDYEYNGRNALIDDLQLKNVNGNKGPLLAQILRAFCSQTDDNTPVSSKKNNEFGKNTLQADSCRKSTVSAYRRVQNESSEESNIEKLSTSNATGISKNETNVGTGDKMSEDALISLKDMEITSKPSKTKNFSEKNPNQHMLHQDDKSVPSASNGLLLLGNLPPLTGSNKTTLDYAKSSNVKKDINQIKTMINSLDNTDNNYDEDFQSSASGSAREGHSGKNSIPGSDTEEIEEDIGSGIDDVLSNASGLDDLTVDATVSNASGLGDYMENIQGKLLHSTSTSNAVRK